MAGVGAFYKVYKLCLTICLVWITFSRQNLQLHLGWPTFLKKLNKNVMSSYSWVFYFIFYLTRRRRYIPNKHWPVLDIWDPLGDTYRSEILAL